MANRLFQLATA